MEIIIMRIPLLAILLSAALTITGLTDTIKTGSKEEKGLFIEFRDNTFFFHAENGSELKLPKASVSSLIMDENSRAALIRKGSKKRESMEFHGYDKLQFLFKQDSRQISLSAMNITSVKAERSMKAFAGDTVEEGNSVIPPVDTSAIENSPMTAEQRTVLEEYKSVRKKYTDFLEASSALVAEMEKAQGKQRQKILNELRLRKNEEQPVRLEMSAAHKALMSAFPNPAQPALPEPVREPQAAEAGVAAADAVMSAAEENGALLLIDTASLASAQMTDDRRRALNGYNEAVSAFQQASSSLEKAGEQVNSAPDTERAAPLAAYAEAQKKADAAREALLKAQDRFILEFPELKLTE